MKKTLKIMTVLCLAFVVLVLGYSCLSVARADIEDEQNLTPVPDTPTPIPDTPTPVPDTPTPVPDTPTPVPDTPTPVPDTPTPVPNTNTPTPTTQVIQNNTPTPIPTTPPAPNTNTPTPLPTKAPDNLANDPTPAPTNTPKPKPTKKPLPTVAPADKEKAYPAPAKKSEAAADIKSHEIIKIDGIYEDLWKEISALPIKNVSWGESGAAGSFKVFWDKANIYLLVEVGDATNDTASDRFSRKDCIEVFISEKGDMHKDYEEGDHHFKISRTGEVEYGNNTNEDSFVFKQIETEDENKYMFEISIPFTAISPVFGNKVGFDVRVNDSQGKQFRDYMIQWSDTSMYTYIDLSKVGTLVLK